MRSAATLSAVEIHVSLVGHKDLPAAAPAEGGLEGEVPDLHPR
jgi:hypothetical protein